MNIILNGVGIEKGRERTDAPLRNVSPSNSHSLAVGICERSYNTTRRRPLSFCFSNSSADIRKRRIFRNTYRVIILFLRDKTT